MDYFIYTLFIEPSCHNFYSDSHLRVPFLIITISSPPSCFVLAKSISAADFKHIPIGAISPVWSEPIHAARALET